MAIAQMRVPTIFTAVDRFSDVVSRMTAKTTRFGMSAQAVALRTSKSLNDSGTKMLYTGAGIATGLGLAVNEAIKFEKAMATVSTTIDNTTPEMMKRMGDDVLAMAKIIPKPISELTEALYDVVSAGIEGSKSMVVLNSSGRLAVAGLGTTQEAVDVLTSSINSFNIDANDSERIANNVFKAVKYGKTTVSQLAESFGSSSALVKNSNVSLEEYLATTAVLTTTGMTASRAQTQVSSAITALIKPSKTMQAIFSSLGVKDVPTFIKNSKGLIPALDIVRKKADQMGILTSKAFGRKEGFSAMLSLLGPLRSKYDEVLTDITSKTDTLTESVNKQQATTSAGFQRLKNNVTILAIKIGEQLLPAVNSFVDKLTPTIEGISNWIQKNGWLATSVFTVTKWVLILGVAAKIGAFVFRTYAFYLGIVNGVMRVFTFVSTMASLSQVSFGKALLNIISSLGKYVGASLAASASTIAFTTAIVGGVAVIGFGIYELIKGFQNMQFKSDYALRSVSLSWQNATFNIETEINKQNKLISDMLNPQTKNGYNASNLYDLNPNVTAAQDKIDYLSKYKNLPERQQQEALMKWNQNHISPGTEFRLPNDKDVENLAGQNKVTQSDILNMMNSKSGKIDLNIYSKDGLGVDVENIPPSGIEVITKPTQGNR